MIMPRAIWKGALSFGLVNVPVKLVTAVRQQEVKFRQLHDEDGAPIQYKRVCSVDGEEVPYEHIIKGYEIAPDQYVTLTPEELEAVDPEASDTIDIVDFVDISQIDPLYFEKPYYLVPDKGGAKAYGLLVEAMRKAGRVAIARVVLRTKEHLVAVRPVGNALTMTTLLWHDELMRVEQLEGIPAETDAPERELQMAQKLIDALTADFEPGKYTDEHRDRLMQIIEQKAEGKATVAPPRAEVAAPTDLASALEESLRAVEERARGGGGEAEA